KCEFMRVIFRSSNYYKCCSYTLYNRIKLTFILINLLLKLGLRSISVIIESNRSVISFRSINLIEFTDISVSVNYRSVSVNSVSVSVFRFTEPIYRLYNCRLSQHPAVVEGQDYRHSNRLDATSRIVVVLSFYHHWMPR